MNTFKFIVGTGVIVSFMAFAACTHEEPENGPEDDGHDDSYYAALASVSSSDADFAATEEGGTIHFKTEGGSVLVNVDCGTDWTAENAAADLFTTSSSGSSLTVTAGQNTVEEEVSGTISLYTATQHIRFASIVVTQDAYGAPRISVDTQSWHAPAVGALTAEIGVECNLDDYEVAIDDDWLTYEKIGTGITLIASENENTESRETRVEVSATDGIRTGRDYITVTQDGRAYISLSRESVSVPGAAVTAEVEVESNVEWDYTCTADWLEVERSGETLKITFSKNEAEEPRETLISLAGGDGAENTAEVQLTVTQGEVTRPLILEYTLSSAGTSVTLPLYGEVNCIVDWGDGSDAEAVTSIQPTHTYSAAGTYEVNVDGIVTSLYSANFSRYDNRDKKLSAVKQWGNTGLTSMSGAFTYCTALTSIASDTEAFAEVTTFNSAFPYCTTLETVPDNLFANCPLANDFTSVFQGCAALTKAPSFSACPEVTSFYAVFSTCSSLKTLPEDLFAGCSKATDFTNAFRECSSLDDVPAGILSGCSSADTFYYAFYKCTSLTAIPKGLFDDCTAATDFRRVFFDCPSLTVIPEGLFDYCKAATTMTAAFYECESLTSVPAYLFKGLDKVTDFSDLFCDCTSIAEVGAGLFSGCSSATTFANAFESCKKLTSLPADMFEGCSAIEDFTETFYGSKLTEIPAELFVDCTGVTTFNSVFQSNSITAIPGGLFDNCTKVTSFASAFRECKSLTSVPEGLFDKNTAATIMSYIFEHCTSLPSIPDGLFDHQTEAESFKGTFSWCQALQEIPDGLFDNNTKVTSFNNTFSYCQALTSIPKTLFYNCPEVTDFGFVFGVCSLVKEIPEGLFDKNPKVTTFAQAFEFMDYIESIPEDLFDNCPEVNSFYSCFYMCPALKSIPAGLFDNCKKVENWEWTFYNMPNIGGESPYTLMEDGTKVHLYERTAALGFTEPTGTAHCFYNCTGLSDYYSIPSSWGGGGE